MPLPSDIVTGLSLLLLVQVRSLQPSAQTVTQQVAQSLSQVTAQSAVLQIVARPNVQQVAQFVARPTSGNQQLAQVPAKLAQAPAPVEESAAKDTPEKDSLNPLPALSRLSTNGTAAAQAIATQVPPAPQQQQVTAQVVLMQPIATQAETAAAPVNTQASVVPQQVPAQLVLTGPVQGNATQNQLSVMQQQVPAQLVLTQPNATQQRPQVQIQLPAQVLQPQVQQPPLQQSAQISTAASQLQQPQVEHLPQVQQSQAEQPSQEQKPQLLAESPKALGVQQLPQQESPRQQAQQPAPQPKPIEALQRHKEAHPQDVYMGTSPGGPETSWFGAHRYWLSSIMQGLTFAGVIKALCVAGNIVVQVSPFPQAMRWEKRRDTGGADSAPYVSIAFGGWQWCFYGTMAWITTGRSGFLILVQSNFLGLCLGSYYVSTFYRMCRSSTAKAGLLKYLSCVMALVLLQASAICALPAERGLFLVGSVSAFCSFLGALSVVTTLPDVIRCKDSRSIPGPLVIANTLSSLAWTVCGVLLNDNLITMPNIMNLCTSGLCTYLKMVYPSLEEESCDDKLAEHGPEKIRDLAKAVEEAAMCATERTPLIAGKGGEQAKNRKAVAMTAFGPPLPDDSAEEAVSTWSVFSESTGGTY